MAEVVREAVDRALAEHDRRERRRRALSVLGRFGGDASDVAANHDKYLDEAYLS
jgi:Arc/MetJ-type ribon-helix-helix transcriptional regulator